MALCFSFRVALLLSLWTTSTCDIPRGVLYTECRERYFMIAAGLSFAGNEPRFEAVDSTGVHAITEQYAAECGYAISFFPLLGRLELRASYFSCHTDNTDDNVFAFNFNLIVTHEGKQTTYALNKTCTLSLPWSPREVTCEVNYMEVSVRSEAACPSENNTDSAFKPSLYSDWQVMFQRADEQFQPMNLSEARKLGYVFALTDGRLVFRTPYEKPHSLSTEVNDVPVEVVHAVLFSRQSWVVIVVDLLAACSMHDGLYYGGYMTWETPEPLHCLVSPLSETEVSIGVDGELVEQAVAEKRGYTVEKYNTTVHIGIPYNAEGGHRKSFVSQDLYEYYIFNLYLEQISVDEAKIAARLRFHRTLVTPLQPHPVFTLNETVLEERVFTIYLGDVPEDVQLVSVQLNGQDVALAFINASTHNITEVLHPNTTHGYTLKVLFSDPAVKQKFSRKDVAIQHMLDINYTLAVMPGNEPYHYQASVMALTPVSPPAFDAVCSESGIRFRMAYRPFDYVWQITIGSDVLTSELAERRGYIMSNNSNTLILDVPLYTQGYQYQNVTLTGFSGTFEILVRDRDTSQVQASTVKTCLFYPPEFIMCSTDGRVTVVANLPVVVPSGGGPLRTSLIDKSCGPKDADGTRALFSFPVNGCGFMFELGNDSVTYKNEILYKNYQNMIDLVSYDLTERVIVQCTYPLSGLHQLFTVYRFVSDTVGVGKIIRTVQPTAGLQPVTSKPAAALQSRPTMARQIRKPIAFVPGVRPSARYFRVSKVHNLARGKV